MKFTPPQTLPFVALFLLMLAGCSFDSKVPVTGEVSFDGQPVEDGQIVFADPSGEARSGAGPIKQGSYSLTVSPGKKIVRITAFRETGKIDRSNPGVEKPEIKAYIPEKYNARSTLEITVESGSTTHDFPLEK